MGLFEHQTVKIKHHRESRQHLASEESRAQEVASIWALPKRNRESKADVDRTLILEKGDSAWKARRDKKGDGGVGSLQAKSGVQMG